MILADSFLTASSLTRMFRSAILARARKTVCTSAWRMVREIIVFGRTLFGRSSFPASDGAPFFRPSSRVSFMLETGDGELPSLVSAMVCHFSKKGSGFVVEEAQLSTRMAHSGRKNTPAHFFLVMIFFMLTAFPYYSCRGTLTVFLSLLFRMTTLEG